MSEVIVCAEPEAKEEASQFVSRLGGHPQTRSMRSSLKSLRKAKGLVVYLTGAEPPTTLRSCLKQVSRDRNLQVVVYSLHANERQAAELGKIVGQLRPERTHICFDSTEVQKILHLRMGVDKTGTILGTVIADAAPETVTELRKHLELTQVDVANSLGVTPRTVQNWERRRAVASRRFRDLKELRGLLARYIEENQVSAWMDSPNEAFQNQTPRQLIREGKTRDLILEFGRLQSGEPL
jgi:DNA-binding transcriptional regulator YiaG